jgi:hypothetical protein
MPKPPRPIPALISHYLEEREKRENYRVQEQALTLLFNRYCPENREVEHVLLKVSALNNFYSTNIYDTYSVAKHILGRESVDERLRQGDLSLVGEIARVTLKGRSKNFYSFASKYCSHHSPEKFPIYDFFVEKMLLHYRKSDRFDSFVASDLKDYKRFVAVIERFKTHYGLGAFTLRQIDVFLWLAGKECFPRNYSGGKGKRKDGDADGAIPARAARNINQASKYDALREYLEKQDSREITFRFEDARKAIGFSLPPSAYKYQAFWANQSNIENRPWAKAWKEAGFEVVSYKLSGIDGWVRFKRRNS